MVNRSKLNAAGTVLHRQLFLVIRDRILRGRVLAGESLPTEEALCNEFGVSRITVRRALSDLANAGLVERRHGLGTFVRDDVKVNLSIPNLNMLEELRRSHLETEVRVIELEKETPPQDVAILLRLESEQLALRAVRLRSIDEIPVMITEAWIPESYSKGVSREILREKALYEALLEQGVVFGRLVQDVSAVMADTQHADLLGVEPGMPLLMLKRLMFGSDGHPILHLTAYLTQISRIVLDVPAEDINKVTTGQVIHNAAVLGS